MGKRKDITTVALSLNVLTTRRYSVMTKYILLVVSVTLFSYFVKSKKPLLFYLMAVVVGSIILNGLVELYQDRISPVSNSVRAAYYPTLDLACSTETEHVKILFIPLDVELPVRTTKEMINTPGEVAQKEWVLNRQDAEFNQLCSALRGRIVPKRFKDKERVDIRWKIGFYGSNNQTNFVLYGDGAGLADFNGAMIYYPRSIDRRLLKHFGVNNNNSPISKFATKISYFLTFI